MTKRLLLFLFLIPTLGWGQSKKEIRKDIKKARPYFLQIGVQASSLSLRDTGTSPRFYSGPRGAVNISTYQEDSLRVSYWGGTAGFGFYNDDGLIEVLSWLGPSFSIELGDLWKLKPDRPKKVEYAVGYSIRSFIQVRNNQRLFNSGFGLDNLTSLGPSFGLFFPFERAKGWTKKFGFIKIKAQPRKYALGVIAHLPLLTVSSRPEYTYVPNVVDPETSSFDTYRFQLGGYLVQTETNFTYYLHNGNALRLYYRWQAMETGDTFKLNLAEHAFGLNMMIRMNKINRDERY